MNLVEYWEHVKRLQKYNRGTIPMLRLRGQFFSLKFETANFLPHIFYGCLLYLLHISVALVYLVFRDTYPPFLMTHNF